MNRSRFGNRFFSAREERQVNVSLSLVQEYSLHFGVGSSQFYLILAF